LPVEEKESFKWIKSYRALGKVQSRCSGVKLVSVGDRDADFYELFVEWEERKPDILVRAARSRNRNTTEGWLWSLMEKEPASGDVNLHIPRRGKRRSRDAVLRVSFRGVELIPPIHKRKKFPSVKAYAIYLVEKDPAQEVDEPIEWMLLTTVPTRNMEEAMEKVKWYTYRWGIEVFHRTLKSGRRIEDRRLGSSENLESCLAIDMVVAWRTFFLVQQSRKTPNVPCTVFFEPEEWKALVCLVKKTPEIPKTPPTLGEAGRMVASLGGFLGRKSDGDPGVQTTWKGLIKLEGATQVYRVLRPSEETCTVSKQDYG
jgi:hypothetical protein